MRNRKFIAILAILLIAFAAVLSACGCNIPTRYTIKFDSMGGTAVNSITNIHSGTLVNAPKAPYWDEHIFMGWCKDALCLDEFDFTTTKIRQDWTLYAKWVDAMLVIFETGGGSDVARQNVLEGSLVTEPEDPTRDKYIFDGWYKDAEYNVAWDFATDTADFSPTYIYAKWLNVYEVTFDLAGGEGDIPSQNVVESKLASEPEVEPTRLGYEFVGWYTQDIDGNYVSEWDFETNPVMGDITLFAKWQFIPYEIGFYRHFVDIASESPYVVYDNMEIGKPFSKPTPDPTFTDDYYHDDYYGYVFAGWWIVDGEGNYIAEWDFNDGVVPFEGINLVAKWDNRMYNLTFWYNDGREQDDGNGNMIGYIFNQQNVEYLAYIVDPGIPARIGGYKFLGWAGGEAYGVIDYADFTNKAEYDEFMLYLTAALLDVNARYTKDYENYYAVWEVEYYTVTFLAPDADDAAYEQIFGFANGDYIFKYNSPIFSIDLTGIEPIRLGYTLIGWTLDLTAQNVTLWNFDFDTISGNTTLYAVWERDEYTVTFDGQGGSPVPEEIEGVFYGEKIDDPNIIPHIPGLTFRGWTTVGYEVDATGWETDLWNFATSVVTGDTTLFAYYTTDYYTVSFVFHQANGSDPETRITIGGNGTGFFKYNDFIIRTQIPTGVTVPGMKVGGWYTDAALTTEWNFETDKVTGDTVLYARWEKEYYTVTFYSNGGSEVDPITGIEYDTTIEKPVDPVRPGYIFAGWFTDDTLTQAWNFETDKVVYHMPLYAKWTEVTYTVVYMNNGVVYETLTGTYKYGDTIVAPTLGDPTRTGYTFGGWSEFENLSAVWNFATSIITAYDPTSGTYTLYMHAIWEGSSNLIYGYINTGNGIIYGVIGYDKNAPVETAVAIPEYHNGIKVEGIGANAFSPLTNVDHVIFGANIYYVGVNAFYGCSVTSIDFNDGLKYIDTMGFCTTNLVNVVLPEGLEHIGSLAFNACKYLEEITIPSTVTFIGERAFIACNLLTKVTFLMSDLSLVTVESGIFTVSENVINVYVPFGMASAYTQMIQTSMGLAWDAAKFSVTELPAPAPIRSHVILHKKED